MAVKAALVAMAPEADAERHRATIKTPKLELISVIADAGNFDHVVEVCRKLVQNEGVQVLILCPGFSHQAVAEVAAAVGDGVPINVARGDTPSVNLTRTIFKKAGW
jgi:hypothetical protein